MPTKVRVVKTMIISVVIYGCENWTIKKAEHRRIDAFELWCWRRLLRVTWSPLDCKEIQPVHPKGNLSWIFIGRTDAEAGTPIFWPPDEDNWLTGKDLDAGKDWLKAGGEGDNRGWDGWMASPTQWTWVWVSSASWWWTGRPGVLQSMGSQRVGNDWATELTVIGLYRSVQSSFSSWVSFSNLCLSRNLSISSKLSNLLIYSWS